jgi:hypothetical protein
MKKNDVKVGETYRVKVSGNVADVRITGVNPHGGWDGLNVTTKRKVRIKSPQRLRGKSPARPGGKRVMTKAQYEAEAKREAKVATGAKKARKATQDAKPAGKRDTAERAAKGAKRPSGLDAAAQVLTDADDPLSVKEIVALALGRKLWQTSGKTPAATIYAAIIREIATKGDAARFRKVARGRFELAAKKGA